MIFKKLLAIILFTLACTHQKQNGVHLDKLQDVSEVATKCEGGKIVSYSPVSTKHMLTHAWVYECEKKSYNCSLGSNGPICI
jgi:hypothetical protein